MRICRCLGLMMVVLLAGWAITSLAQAEDCNSETGCVECQWDGSLPSCQFVRHDASCDCFVGLVGIKSCGTNGVCFYDPSNLGPWGGPGGGGGGGGTCTIMIGEWCPPSCTSCNTVFWY